MAPTLSAQNLSVRIGQKTLLDSLTFTVQAGEHLGLIGPSGSGKSMFARTVMGLLPARANVSGSLQVAGKQIVGAPEKEMGEVRGALAAMIFQDPLTALDPLQRIGRQLSWPIRHHQGVGKGKKLREAVRAALTEVHLADADRIAHAYPHELSGGQRQRVAIALALACQPQILLADEPTTALDVTVQQQILQLLKEVTAARKTTLIFISHDLPVVTQLVGRTLVLNQGQVTDDVPVPTLLAGAGVSPRARAIVQAARNLEDALAAAQQGDRP